MEQTITDASSRIIESSVFAAAFIGLFCVVIYVVVKYYIPGQQAIAMKKAELESISQSQRDQYNQSQVDRLIEAINKQQEQHEAQLKTMSAQYDINMRRASEDHAKQVELLRGIFEAENERQRESMKQTADAIVLGMHELKEAINKTFISATVGEAIATLDQVMMKRTEH